MSGTVSTMETSFWGCEKMQLRGYALEYMATATGRKKIAIMNHRKHSSPVHPAVSTMLCIYIYTYIYSYLCMFIQTQQQTERERERQLVYTCAHRCAYTNAVLQ